MKRTKDRSSLFCNSNHKKAGSTHVSLVSKLLYRMGWPVLGKDSKILQDIACSAVFAL